jgi:uncharacterized protein YPO0396
MEALTMERPMGNWNDERLDEMNGRMEAGFTEVGQRFERLEGEMKDGFAKVATKAELGAVKRELEGARGELKDEIKGFKDELKGALGEFKGELKGELGEVKVELRHLGERFDKLLHALMVAGVGVGITLLAAFGGFVVTQA